MNQPCDSLMPFVMAYVLCAYPFLLKNVEVMQPALELIYCHVCRQK